MTISRYWRAPRGQRRAAFTLIELLTVISIIGILAAILIPTIKTVFARARASQSQNNLHSIGAAMQLYATDNKGRMPAPMGTGSKGSTDISKNPTGKSWVWEVMSYAGMTAPQNGAEPNWTSSNVMFDPEYYAREGSIADPQTPILGYGMNIYPYRPSPKSDPQNSGTGSADIAHKQDRQLLTNLPKPSNNVIVGCSNEATLEPGQDGSQSVPTSDPTRYSGSAVYLFLDGSVRMMDPDEAKEVLKVGR